MSILPLLGTTYKSLDAFRLDIKQRAALHSFEFNTRDSKKDRRLWLNCSTRTPQKLQCTFRVVVNKEPSGLFEVAIVNETHSCRKGEVSRGGEGKESRLGRKPNGTLNDSGGGGEAGDDDGDMEQNRVRLDSDGESQEASVKAKSDANCQSETDSNGSTSVKGPKGEQRGKEGRKRPLRTSGFDRFPSAQNLRSEISLLLATHVDLPSSTQDFAEPPHQLLTILHAYAQQNGFSLYRRSDGKNSFYLRCTRGHHRYIAKPGGSCKFAISARRGSDGTWSVLPPTAAHNHSVGSLSKVSTSSAPANPATESSSSLPRSQVSSPLPSSAPRTSRSQTSVAPPTCQPLLPPQLESSGPTNVPSSVGLASLLRPFHSLFEAQRTLVFLHSIGVDSVETLTELLMMEDEGFKRFIGGIEIGIGNKLRTMRNDLQEELAG